MSYNTELQTNNTDLEGILASVRNLPTAGGGSSENWELIASYTDFTEEAAEFSISHDSNGDPFTLKKAMLFMLYPKYTGSTTIPSYHYSVVNGLSTGANAPLMYTYMLCPNTAQQRNGVYIVECKNGNYPYHEKLIKTETSANSRCYGINNGNLYREFFCFDGTEPAPNGITSIGVKGNVSVYEGCAFYLLGVRA